MSSNGLTLTELMELASGVSSDRSEAELFFKENSIEDGTNWVDDRLVYWQYLKWCYTLQRTPIDRKTFIKGAQQRFKRHSARGKCFFKLSDSFAINKEEWDVLLHDYNVEKGYEQWRKKLSQAQKARRKSEKQQRKRGAAILKMPDSKNDSSQE